MREQHGLNMMVPGNYILKVARAKTELERVMLLTNLLLFVGAVPCRTQVKHETDSMRRLKNYLFMKELSKLKKKSIFLIFYLLIFVDLHNGQYGRHVLFIHPEKDAWFNVEDHYLLNAAPENLADDLGINYRFGLDGRLRGASALEMLYGS